MGLRRALLRVLVLEFFGFRVFGLGILSLGSKFGLNLGYKQPNPALLRGHLDAFHEPWLQFRPKALNPKP